MSPGGGSLVGTVVVVRPPRGVVVVDRVPTWMTGSKGFLVA